MSNEKMREEFEAWASSPEFGLRDGHFVKGDEGEYLNYPTQCYFQVWQASRAAIEVELPIAHGAPRNSSSYQEGIADGFERGVYRCQEAIESLGLRIKPLAAKPSRNPTRTPTTSS